MGTVICSVRAFSLLIEAGSMLHIVACQMNKSNQRLISFFLFFINLHIVYILVCSIVLRCVCYCGRCEYLPTRP